ncbi:MAG TPA: hypothetical protein VF376_10665 [Thermoanaerobaculia bacterium]
MTDKRVREATERVFSRERDMAEITLPFRIVCTRRESNAENGHLLEVRVLPAGRSLLEPRSTS